MHERNACETTLQTLALFPSCGSSDRNAGLSYALCVEHVLNLLWNRAVWRQSSLWRGESWASSPLEERPSGRPLLLPTGRNSMRRRGHLRSGLGRLLPSPRILWYPETKEPQRPCWPHSHFFIYQTGACATNKLALLSNNCCPVEDKSLLHYNIPPTLNWNYPVALITTQNTH